MALSEIELDALAAGDDVATDVVTARHYQYVKMTYGAAGTVNEVTSTTTNPFPVALSDTDNAVLDAIAAAQLPDGHAVTVDNASGASAVNIQDGGNSITVDNGGTFAVQATLDAETTKVIGTVNIAAGQSITADLGANNDVTVTSGTVTANLGATDNAVLDQIEVNTSYGDSVGGGTEAAALRVTLANDSTGVLSVDDNGGSLTVDGTVTANLSATDNAVLDTIVTNTTRGSSHYRNIDANAESSIKGSAGTLHWIHAINLTAAIAYVHLYDATTASVTPGTTTPDFTFPIPTQGDTNGAGFNLKLDHEFTTAITLVVTTTTDGSTGDPGTNGVMVNAGYS